VGKKSQLFLWILLLFASENCGIRAMLMLSSNFYHRSTTSIFVETWLFSSPVTRLLPESRAITKVLQSFPILLEMRIMLGTINILKKMGSLFVL
jgi:hypothetical protein